MADPHPRAAVLGARTDGRPSGMCHEIAAMQACARDLAGARGAPAGAVSCGLYPLPPPGGAGGGGNHEDEQRQGHHPRTHQRRGLASYLREIGSARWRLPRVPAARRGPPGEPGGVCVDVAVAARSDSDGASFETVLGSRAHPFCVALALRLPHGRELHCTVASPRGRGPLLFQDVNSSRLGCQSPFACNSRQ